MNIYVTIFSSDIWLIEYLTLNVDMTLVAYEIFHLTYVHHTYDKIECSAILLYHYINN